jgi:hypothetical protein
MEDGSKCLQRLWSCLNDRYVQQNTVPPSEASRGSWDESLTRHRNENVEVVRLTLIDIALDKLADDA